MMKNTEQYVEELECDIVKLIEERDQAEEALGEIYRAVTGKFPSWSNMFSYNDAVEEVFSRLLWAVEAGAIRDMLDYEAYFANPDYDIALENALGKLDKIAGLVK